MQQKGWYVYKIGGRIPEFRHTSFESAVNEAKRLFNSIGGEYLVLRTEAKISAPPSFVVEDFRNDMDIPF